MNTEMNTEMNAEQVIERILQAPIALIWELLTTPEGRSAWYGPPGFRAEVTALVPEVGGAFHYTMHAQAPEMLAAMQAAGRPSAFTVHGTITEVVPLRRLTYEAAHGPHTLRTVVELTPREAGVLVRVRLSGQSAQNLAGAARGWGGALGKLEALIAARAA